MMSRRTRPSASTTRTAPTAPCVPVARDGARVPRSVPAEAGPVTGMGSCASVEGGSERSTGSADGLQRALDAARLDIPGAGPLARRRDRSVPRPGRARDLHDHRRRPLLRPFRVAGLGVPRRSGGDPLSRHRAVRRRSGTATSRTSCRSRRPTASRAASCRSRRCRRLVLVPFVAVWGLATDDQTIFTILAAIDIALCWWALGRLPVSTAVRFATTVFFAFGTVFWYTAQLATSWYQAHIVAVGLRLRRARSGVGWRSARRRTRRRRTPDDPARSTAAPRPRASADARRRATPVRSPVSSSGLPARPG